MKNFVLLLFLSLYVFELPAQSITDGFVGIGTEDPESKLSLIGLTSGANDRTFLTLRNNSIDLHSAVILKLQAGLSDAWTALYHHSDTYGASVNSSKLGVLWNNGSGLLLKATDSGIIKFETGATFTTEEHMRINIDGNVGIGTTLPSSKLQVKQGDVYIEDIGNGVIMKSPNGNCWRYTPDNDGNLVPLQITCPI